MSNNRITDDLVGMRFGKLEVLGVEGIYGANKVKVYLCKCDCGNTVLVKRYNLTRSRYTKSCGHCTNSFYVKSKLYTYGSKTYTLKEWASILGIPLNTLRIRLKRGWSIEKTLTTPVYSFDMRTKAYKEMRNKENENNFE